MAHTSKVANDLVTAKSIAPRKTGTGARLAFLSREDRERRRQAFLTLFTFHGARAKIARSWGVSTTLVSHVCLPVSHPESAPLTDARIAALPPSMRTALLAELAEPKQLVFSFLEAA